jgi:hypothetical protein
MIRSLFHFRRKQAAEAPQPDATIELLKSDWRCSCCDELHHGLMDMASRAPDPWPHDKSYEPNSALRLEGDFLSEDFCVLEGKYFFVRSVLEIPVHGLQAPWGFGCWSTLSRTNFDKYVAGFDSGEYEDDGPWFGWLSNHLKIYFEDADPIGVDVFPQPDRQRPLLIVQDDTHPLGIAQREGITPEAMLRLLRACGHGPTAH